MFIIAAAGTAKALLAVTISLHPAAHHAQASYTVKQGDTLSAIATHAYGNAADWPAVWWVNRHQVPNPNVIAAGQRLQLPASGQVPAWMAHAAQAAVPAGSRPRRRPGGGGERLAGGCARCRAGLHRGPGLLRRGQLVGHRSV